MNKKFLCALLLFISFFNINAQQQQVEQLDSNKLFKMQILPVIYYLPETSFAFGMAGVSTFRLSKKQKRASLFQFATDYTLKKQLILTSVFDIFSNDETYRLIGELSYFDYFYNFYGLGINTRDEDFEKFKAKFPRARFNIYRKFAQNFNVGLLYQYEGINSVDYKDNGLIANNEYIGKEGGKVSNIGIGLLFDIRDNILSAHRGFFGELQFFNSSDFLGSNFKYQKASLDLRYYKKITDKAVLATNIYIASTFGGAPFYDLYMFGSNNRGRGVNDRRYRDNSYFITQGEVRLPLKGRFRANIFGSLATVNSRLDYLFNDKFIPAIGLGLRYLLNKNERSMLRFDVGRSRTGFAFYLTTNEAF